MIRKKRHRHPLVPPRWVHFEESLCTLTNLRSESAPRHTWHTSVFVLMPADSHQASNRSTRDQLCSAALISPRSPPLIRRRVFPSSHGCVKLCPAFTGAGCRFFEPVSACLCKRPFLCCRAGAGASGANSFGHVCSSF